MDPKLAAAIAPGSDVYSSDGEKLGTVAGTHDAVIHVEKGFFFVKDYNIPITAIDRVDVENGAVHLNVTNEVATSSDWDVADEDMDDDVEPYDSPIDGDGYTVLSGAAHMPSPIIVQESADPVPDSEGPLGNEDPYKPR